MKWAASIAICALVVGCDSSSLVAQIRSSGSARPSRPSTPAPPTIPPLRSPLIPVPSIVRPEARGGRSGLIVLPLFDPYSWTPIMFGPLWVPPAPPSEIDAQFMGGLQLDVEPRRAAVSVDGLYAGIVADFSGYYHHLDLPAGHHVLQFLATDHDPLVIDVVISPGRTTTYRGALNRR